MGADFNGYRMDAAEDESMIPNSAHRLHLSRREAGRSEKGEPDPANLEVSKGHPDRRQYETDNCDNKKD